MKPNKVDLPLMEEQKIARLYKENTTVEPDPGFRERVVGRLPEKTILWLAIAKVLTVGLCLGLVFLIFGTDILRTLSEAIKADGSPELSMYLWFSLATLVGSISFALIRSVN